MLAKILLLLLPIFLLAEGYAKPKSFTHAIKIFKQIDMETKRTSFSQKEYEYDPATCMRKLYLKDDHTQKVVFERIVPEDIMAKNLKCFTQDVCTDMMGKVYHGKRCCRKSDTLYREYEKDLFNLYTVEKDSPFLKLTPPLHFRGNVARVYLYMNKRYGLNLDKNKLVTLEIWNKEDVVDKQECQQYQTIYKIQKYENPWIKPFCKN